MPIIHKQRTKDDIFKAFEWKPQRKLKRSAPETPEEERSNEKLRIEFVGIALLKTYIKTIFFSDAKMPEIIESLRNEGMKAVLYTNRIYYNGRGVQRKLIPLKFRLSSG